MMIVFASAADYSVGKLFMGGVIPGLLMAFGNMLVCYIYARKMKVPKQAFGGFKNIVIHFFKSIGALAMPAVIIIGIVTGICTATEAGVLACVYGLIYGCLLRKLNIEKIMQCLIDACLAASGPLMNIVYSGVFSYMLTRMNVAKQLGAFSVTYISTQAGFFYFLLLVGLLVGCFIDGLASTVMFLPVMAPVVSMMGIDFQHFAIVYLLSLLTSQLTPPVGNLLFVAAGIRNTPIGKIYKTCWPFVLVMIVVVILCIHFPAFSCWLPSKIG
jgi:C4-dicarboxylate transporter DctM subunit